MACLPTRGIRVGTGRGPASRQSRVCQGYYKFSVLWMQPSHRHRPSRNGTKTIRSIKESAGFTVTSDTTNTTRIVRTNTSMGTEPALFTQRQCFMQRGIAVGKCCSTTLFDGGYFREDTVRPIEVWVRGRTKQERSSFGQSSVQPVAHENLPPSCDTRAGIFPSSCPSARTSGNDAPHHP